MKVKRGQSSIISTVLIVLVALVAVGILGVFIFNQVRSSMQEAEVKAKLSQLSISVTSAEAGNNYIILRKDSQVNFNISNISILIKGYSVNANYPSLLDWQVLDTRKIMLPNDVLMSGDSIEIFIIPFELGSSTPFLVAKTQILKNSSSPTNITDSSLIGYWALDNNTNDFFKLNNGVWGGTESYVLGVKGYAASFNGVNSSIALGNGINGSNMKTISVWLKFNSINTPQEIISASSNHCGLELVMYANYLGSYAMSTYCSDTLDHGGSSVTYPGSSLTLNKWYHVVVTQNGSGSLLNLYVNGSLVGSTLLDNSIGNIKSDGSPELLKLGSWYEPVSYPYGGRRFFNGAIDELKIYNRAFNSTEVQALYLS